MDFDRVAWVSMNGPPGANHQYFAQDPYRPAHVYLGTARSVYRSRDRGDTWTRIYDGESLAVAFSSSRVFLCAGQSLSVVEGATLSGPRPACTSVFAIGDAVYVALETDRTVPSSPFVSLRRADANASSPFWIDIGPSDAEVATAVPGFVSAEYSAAVSQLFATDGGLLARISVLDEARKVAAVTLMWSGDDGATWSPSSFSLASPLLIKMVAQDAADADHLALAAGDASPDVPMLSWHPLSELILDSRDGGKTWSTVTTSTRTAPEARDIDIVGGSYVLTDVDRAMVELVGPGYDDLVDWPATAVPGYATPYDIEELIVDVENPKVMWGRGRLGWDGVIRTDDGGTTWKRKLQGVTAAPAPNLAVHPTDSQVVVACGNLGFLPHITRDGGASWEPLGGTFLMADEVGFDPHVPTRMLMIDELSRMAESNDGGRTWHELAPHFTMTRVHDFAVSTAGQGIIYASNLGLNVSSLANANSLGILPEINWQNMPSSPDYAYDIELDRTDPNVLYATYSPKIFESHASVWRYDATQAAGGGWTEALRVEGAAGMTSVTLDPANPETVYAAATGDRARLFVSRDGGESWSAFAAGGGFTFVTVHEIAVDPQDELRAWAAPWGGGLFESTDGGATWSERPSPSRSLVTLLASGDALLAADRTQPVIWESGDGGTTWTDVVRLDVDRFTRIMSMAWYEGQLYFSALERSGETPPSLRGVVFRAGLAGLEELASNLPGPVLRFAPHPSGLYAVTHLRGVYRFDGDEWHDLSANLPDMGFFDLVVDGAGRILVAGGSDLDRDLIRRIGDDAVVHQIYRTEDGGASWAPLLAGDPFHSAIKRLIRHPHRPEWLYAATGTGLWLSMDEGQTWRPQAGMAFENLGALAVGPGRLYAGTLGGGVYGGTIWPDGVVSWQPSTGPLPRIQSLQVRVSPGDSKRIYATAFPGGVFRSLDGGETWLESNFALPSFNVLDPVLEGYYSLAIDPVTPATLYLGVFRHGVFRSDDGGATWTPQYRTPAVARAGIRRVAVDPTDPRRVLLATDDGVWISRDRAETWEPMNAGLDTRDVLSIDVDDTGRVLVGTAGYGIYWFDGARGEFSHVGRTVGTGEWHVWERRLYLYSALLFAPDDPRTIYLGHFPSGFFVSRDAGAAWTIQVLGLGNDGMFSLAVHPRNSDLLFAGTYNGVVRSDDRGRTWRQTSAGMPREQWPFAVVIDDARPQVMYASTKNGQNKGFCDRNDFCGVLMKSTDGGASWFEIMNGVDRDREFYMVVIHPRNHDVLFVSTSKGVFASSDAGASWVGMNAGLPTLEHRIRDNVAKNLWLAADGGSLVLGIADYGVWRADLSVLGL